MGRRLINELLIGDCLALLPRVASASVHLVLCDLPYGTTRNRWDSPIPLDRLWAEYRRVLTPGGVVVLTCQGPFTARVILSNEVDYKYKWVWEKSKPTNFLNAKKQPLRAHEDVCVFYRGRPTYNPQMTPGLPYDKGVRKAQQTGSYGDFGQVRVRSDGARYPRDVLRFTTAESEGEVWHPTQKPVALGRYFVRTYTHPGDVVLDNAFGSGSFLVAAVLERRNYLGMELDADTVFFRDQPAFQGEALSLYDIAKRRLQSAFATVGTAQSAEQA